MPLCLTLGNSNWTRPRFGLISSGNTLLTQPRTLLSFFCSKGAGCWHMITWCLPGSWAAVQLVRSQWILGDWGCSPHVQDLELPFYELQEVPVSLFFQQPVFPACWGLWIAAQTSYVVQQTIYSAQFCLISQPPSGGLPFYSVCELLTLLNEGPVLIVSVVR